MIIPRKVLWSSLLVLVLAAAGYILIRGKSPVDPGVPSAGGETAAAEGGAAPGDAPGPAPLSVRTAAASRSDLVMTLKSPGEAYTERKVALKSEVGGRIKTFAIGEGRRVREGDTLLELDDTEYRLTLENKEAQRLKFLSELHLEKQFAAEDKEAGPEVLARLDEAQAAFGKAGDEFRAGRIDQAALEAFQRAYELALIDAGRKRDEIIATTKGLTGAEIEVKMARRNLEKTGIRAPFAGILTDIKVSPHERIEAGREICTIVDIGRVKVRARVLESEIGKMRIGREVDLRFSAYPDKVFKGRVEAVSPIVDAADKTCAVHIDVDNASEEIKPGMHAEVEIAAEIHRDRLLVPQEALLVRNGRKLVFVVEGDLAKWRYVEVGLENEAFAEILPSAEPGWGVLEGEPVIVEGHFTLAHDARVTVSK